MKIYYTGNLCSNEEFDKIINISKVKPSVAGTKRSFPFGNAA